MSTGLIKAEQITAMRAIAQRGKDYAMQMASADDIGRQMLIFQGVAELKSMLTNEVVSGIKAAANSGLTFKMDRNDYPIEVVRECVAEALIRGLSLVGNEFNIIGGNFYTTKEGWSKRLKSLGAKRVQCVIGDAEDFREKPQGNKGFMKLTAFFRGRASCEYNGKTEQVTRTKDDVIDGRICVTAFGRDIEDAMAGLKGKAEARMLRLLYFYLADEPDSEPDDVVEELPSNTIDGSFEPVVEHSEKFVKACELIEAAKSDKDLFRVMEQAGKYDTSGVLHKGEFSLIEQRAQSKRLQLQAG